MNCFLEVVTVMTRCGRIGFETGSYTTQSKDFTVERYKYETMINIRNQKVVEKVIQTEKFSEDNQSHD